MKLSQMIGRKINFFKGLRHNTLSLTRAAKKILDLKIKGEGNSLVIKTDKFHHKSHLKIRVNGCNNKIVLGKGAFLCRSFQVAIYGDNCSIVIGENLQIGVSLSINIGHHHPYHGKVENAHCQIGDNVRIEDLTITTVNSHNKIKIGNRCLISSEVTFYNTDGHPIYDLKTRKLKNYVSDMTISDNCWIGLHSTLLKNTFLPRGTIVGWGSVVSKKFEKENCAIAGNPAKVVKEGLVWDFGGDMAYIENKKESAS